MAQIIRSIGSDGKEVLSNILDRYTGEQTVFKEISSAPSDYMGLLNIMYLYKYGKWYLRECDVLKFQWFGAVSDGNEVSYTGTNNTTQINIAIKAASLLKKPLEINGKYLFSPILINRSNVTINLVSGSYIIGGSTLGENERLLNVYNGVSNVEINAYGSTITAPVFGVGEQRHLININNCSNVYINGIRCVNGGGDGIYIGSSIAELPTNININDITTDNVKRNGISLINGVNILISNPTLKNTVGIAPMAGIDIEPNIDTTGFLTGVRIVGAKTSGNGGHGILVAIGAYSKLIEKKLDISIEDHVSVGDGLTIGNGGFAVVGTSYITPWDFKTVGNIVYKNGTVVNPGSQGFLLHSMNPAFSPRVIADLVVTNPGTLYTSTAFYRSGGYIWSGAGATYPNGNVDLTIKVLDTRETPNTATGLYFYNAVQPITDYDIKVDCDPAICTTGKTISQFNGVACSGKLKLITKSLDTVYSSSASISVGSAVAYFGGIVNMNGGGSFILPPVANHIGQHIGIRNGSLPVTVTPQTGDKFIGVSINNTTSSLTIPNVGDILYLEATEFGWKTKYGNKPRVSFTGSQYLPDILSSTAAPTDGTWDRGTIMFNKTPTASSVMGWVCITAGTPGTWTAFGALTADIGKLTSGTTANRPTVTTVGYPYFDTTLGKVVWWNGTVWTSAADVTEIITGQKTFTGASGFSTQSIQSTSGAAGESGGSSFQQGRSGVGYDGVYSGLRLWVSDNLKPIIFANSATAGAAEIARITGAGRLGMGVTSPTGIIHVKAGTAAAGTAPLKLTSGVNLTTPENGAIEYNGTDLFFTPSGATRKTVSYTEDLSVINTTTTALTTADLNTTYPNVKIGFRVICPNITGAPAIYTKATEAGSSDVWLTTSATVTP